MRSVTSHVRLFACLCVFGVVMGISDAYALNPKMQPWVDELQREIDRQELMLITAWPGSGAFAELPSGTVTAINADRSNAMARTLASEALLHAIIAGSQPESLLATVESQLWIARQYMGGAAAPMMAHMYPYQDAVMLPRFAITREALQNAIWVTAASGPITNIEGSVSPQDLQDRFESSDTRLLAREVSLSGSRVISDFIVVESWVEVDDGVVLGTEMWQAKGATIQVDGGELLEHSVIYPQLLNTDFSPLLFSANRNGRMDAFMSQWSGLNIPYPLDPHPPSPECLNCPCCMEVCVGRGLVFSELDSFLHEYVKCPVELALTTQPVVSGSFESESMSDLMGPSYLLDLWQMPSSDGWLDGGFDDLWVDPEGCSDPTIPDIAGGGPGCNFMCVGCDSVAISDPSIGTLHGSGSDEACLEMASGVVDIAGADPICPVESCDPLNPAFDLANAQWDGTLTPFDKVDFLPITCLQTLSDTGTLPAECELGGIDRDGAAHWQETQCPTCVSGGAFEGFTFCPDLTVTQAPCYACDALGHCSQVVEVYDASGYNKIDLFSTTDGSSTTESERSGLVALIGAKIAEVWTTAMDQVGEEDAVVESEEANPEVPDPPEETPQPEEDEAESEAEVDEEEETDDEGGGDTGGDDAEEVKRIDPVEGGKLGWEEDPNGDNLVPLPSIDKKKRPVPAKSGADPIILQSGELVHREVDMVGPPAQARLDLLRSYRSNGTVSTMGRNWTSLLAGERLVIVDVDHADLSFPVYCQLFQPEITCVYRHGGDSGGGLFVRDPSRPAGTFLPEAGDRAVLKLVHYQPEPVASPDVLEPIYILREADGTTTRYNMYGMPTSKEFVTGGHIDYLYGDGNYPERVTSVLNERGHGFRFEYGLAGLIVAVEDVVPPELNGRRVEYCYDLAVLPTYDRSNDAAIIQELRSQSLEEGGLDLDQQKGCYRFVEGTPSLEELDALVRCKRNPGSFYGCFEAAMHEVPVEKRRPSVLRGSSISNKAIRAAALLTEVRVLPDGFYEDDVFVDRYMEGNQPYPANTLVTRYRYSEVSDQLAFHQSLYASAQLDFDQTFSPIGGAGACLRAPYWYAQTMHRAIEHAHGKLVRIERRLNENELTVAGQPVVASSAIYCSPDENADFWMIELENAYEWDADDESYVHVIEQRVGTDVQPSVGASCAVPISTPTLSDGFSTSTPLAALEYFAPDSFTSIPPSIYVELDAAMNTAGHWGQTVSWSSVSCEDIRRTTSPWKHDLIGVFDAQIVTQRDSYRAAQRSANNTVCRVTRRVYPSGKEEWLGMNSRGQQVSRLVDYGGYVVTLNRYNHEGALIEHQIDPVGAGPLVTWTYDDMSDSPLARNNQLSVTRHVMPGSESGTSAFPAGSIVTPPSALTSSFVYEPLTNSVRTQTDPAGRVTETVFEYQESSGALLEARTQLAWWGLYDSAADPFSGIPLHTGDINNDGSTDYARPLVIARLAPPHVSESGPSQIGAFFSYDGYGHLIASSQSSGLSSTYAYAPLTDLITSQIWTSFGPEGMEPQLSAPGIQPTSGGPLESRVDMLGFPHAEAEFGFVGSFTTTTTFERNGPQGRVSRVIFPDGNEVIYAYNGHNAVDTIELPGSIRIDRLFDGYERVVDTRAVDTGTGATLRRTRRLLGPGGAIHGLCRELVNGACDGKLHELVQARTQGSTASALTTLEYDGDGRVYEAIGPEEAGTRFEYVSGGWLLQTVFGFDSTQDLTETWFEYDQFGRSLARQAFTPQESIETRYAFDALGRSAGLQTADGRTVVALFDPVDGATVGHAQYGSDDLLYREITVTRDQAGFPTAQHVEYLSDPSTTSYTTLTTTLKRDEDGRVSCVGSPTGLESRYEYAWHGSVDHAVSSNVPGAPCTGTVGTVLSESWAYADPANAYRKQRTLNPGNGGKATTTVFNDWAGRPLSLSEDRTNGGTSETAFMSLVYDDLGQVQRLFDFNNTVTDFDYDGLGRLTDTWFNSTVGNTSQGTIRTQRFYDRTGRLLTLIDPEGHTTSRTYDGIGRVLTETQPSAEGTMGGLVYGFSYDGLGRLDAITGSGDTWNLIYEPGTSRLASVALPGTGTRSYSYDVAGRVSLASRVEPGYSVDVSREYDGLDRVLTESVTLGTGTPRYADFDYTDSAGRLTNVLVSTMGVHGVRHGFTYNGAQLSQIDGFAIDRSTASPTNTFRLEVAHEGWVPVNNAVFFDPAGIGASPAVWFSKNTTMDHANRAGELSYALGWDTQNPFLTQEQRYYLDNRIAGSLRTWTDSLNPAAQLRVAGYNGMGHLDHVRHEVTDDINVINQWTSQFANEPMWTTIIGGGDLKAASGAFNSTDWNSFIRGTSGSLESVENTNPNLDNFDVTPYVGGFGIQSVFTEGGEQVSVDWDARGRLLSLSNDASRSVTWNGDDLPETITTPAGTEQRYYDAFGRVVRVTRNGEHLDMMYAGWTPLMEFSDCGQRMWWQSGGLDAPAAYSLLWEDDCEAVDLGTAAFESELAVFDMTSDGYGEAADILDYPGETYGVVQDLHNDVVGIFDLGGVVVERYDYDVYGARLVTDLTAAQPPPCSADFGDPCSSSHGNPLGYTGRPLSNITGLYDLRYRQYDPLLRVFLSPDPLGYAASGFDLWLYVNGDPLNFIDPYGLAAIGVGPEREDAPPRLRHLGKVDLPALPAKVPDDIDWNALFLEIYDVLKQDGSVRAPSELKNLKKTVSEKYEIATQWCAQRDDTDSACKELKKAVEGIGGTPTPVTFPSAGSLGTFDNLGDEPEGSVDGQVQLNGDDFLLNGAKLDGVYDFVIQDGEMKVGSGHVALAGGHPVQWAGEIEFRSGKIIEWTNASGHYRPGGEYAENAGLPLDSYRAVEFPVLVGDPQTPKVR